MHLSKYLAKAWTDTCDVFKYDMCRYEGYKVILEPTHVMYLNVGREENSTGVNAWTDTCDVFKSYYEYNR